MVLVPNVMNLMFFFTGFEAVTAQFENDARSMVGHPDAAARLDRRGRGLCEYR
jgi:hypothetical protein